MGDQHNLLPQVLRRQCGHRAGDALAQLHQGFAAGGRKVRVALAPAAGFFGPLGFNVGPGLAFKGAKAALAQAGMQLHFPCRGLAGVLRNGSGRGMGARQVTGVHAVDGLIGQRLRHTLGLPAPFVVEVDVELALDAGVHVPGGFTVAHGDDAGGAHQRLPPVGAGSSTTTRRRIGCG